MQGRGLAADLTKTVACGLCVQLFSFIPTYEGKKPGYSQHESMQRKQRPISRVGVLASSTDLRLEIYAIGPPHAPRFSRFSRVQQQSAGAPLCQHSLRTTWKSSNILSSRNPPPPYVWLDICSSPRRHYVRDDQNRGQFRKDRFPR